MNIKGSHQLFKESKKIARKSLKKHYWVFIVVCLFAAIVGTSGTESLDFLTARKSLEQINTVNSEDYNKKTTETTDNSLPSSLGDIFSETILHDIVSGNHKKAEEKVKKEEANEKKKNESLGGVVSLNHQKGILASVVNKFSSGAVIVTIYSAIRTILRDSDWAAFVFVLLSALFLIALWVFISNIYHVIMKRFFMEGSTYEKVSTNRFFFLIRLRRHFKVSLGALKWTVYESLWSLTIVGYFIKHYAYFMTPYILAENPGMTGSEAITLSRRMMNGHKMQCFLLSLSFIFWNILSLLTFGLLSLFYVAPYKEATFAQYYKTIRKEAIDNKIEGYEALNDKYLFETPDYETVKEEYEDIRNIKSEGTVLPKEHGVKGFFAKWLGIIPSFNEYEHDYRRIQINNARIKNYKDILDGKSYPRRLFTLEEKEKKNRDESMLYTRRYSICSLILIFFVFCLIGWVWEVSLHFVEHGNFINRGVNYGPWLPIYGVGGVGTLILFTRIKKHPMITFFASIVFCGLIEYLAGIFLYARNGVRFWNYNGYFLNIDGYVCAEGLLVFGLGCMAIIYVVAPKLDNIFCRIPLKILIPICALLISVFLVDNIYSSKHPNVQGMAPKSRVKYLQTHKQ